MAEQIKNLLKGLLLIFLGLSIFFPELFNVFVFKIVLALVLIWAGVSIIFRNNNKKNHNKNNVHRGDYE